MSAELEFLLTNVILQDMDKEMGGGNLEIPKLAYCEGGKILRGILVRANGFPEYTPWSKGKQEQLERLLRAHELDPNEFANLPRVNLPHEVDAFAQAVQVGQLLTRLKQPHMLHTIVLTELIKHGKFFMPSGILITDVKNLLLTPTSSPHAQWGR